MFGNAWTRTKKSACGSDAYLIGVLERWNDPIRGEVRIVGFEAI